MFLKTLYEIISTFKIKNHKIGDVPDVIREVHIIVNTGNQKNTQKINGY